nr:flagellar motor protein MotB [uncultured Limnobacter sp.]
MNNYYLGSSRNQEEGEKPFWISYADLMTALMILFLVIMVSALTAISNQVEQATKSKQSAAATTKPESESPEPATELDMQSQQRMAEIGQICEQIKAQSGVANPNIEVDCGLHRIDFGEAGRFARDDFRLDTAGESALLDLVPVILAAADTDLGRKWLKQILIEGFTDTDGSYLYNLNLSLKRSEWVMCTLLRNDAERVNQFTPVQRKQIKKLFLAGGVSFNQAKISKDESRRVELRLQFHGLTDDTGQNPANEFKFENDTVEKCFI